MRTDETKTDKPSISYSLNYRAWLARDIRCPHCRRPLKAADIQADDDGDVRLICQLCANDLLILERL